VSGERARGFTLLEVMVALAILASAMLALSQVVSGALRNHVRASHLDVATLLARGKLADLEDEYETKGFRDFDQSADGTFESDGHPEVRWKAEVLKPKVELGPDRILGLLTGGEGDLSKLLGQAAGGKPGEPTTVQTGAAGVAASLQQQLTVIGEQIKKGVRELRLTVSWPDGKKDESFTIVEHLVVLTPREVAP
jgi:general secretion pathway protein I